MESITNENKKQYRREYYIKNKERISANFKKYYEKNKDELLEKATRQFICSCGETFSLKSKYKHPKGFNHFHTYYRNVVMKEFKIKYNIPFTIRKILLTRY